jgi:putative IMPACT (imprinted ancient) family translation regulator
MFSDEYKTIEARAEAVITDRGSKFTGVIVPADSTMKADEWMTRLKEEFADALDHVFVSRIGLKDEVKISSGGAERIAKNITYLLEAGEITNVLLVVFREAAEKAPKSPSEQAYRDAAANALRRAKIVTRILFDIIKFQLQRDDLEMVSRLITDNRGKVVQTVSEPELVISVKIRKMQSADLKKILIDATSGRAQPV